MKQFATPIWWFFSLSLLVAATLCACQTLPSAGPPTAAPVGEAAPRSTPSRTPQPSPTASPSASPEPTASATANPTATHSPTPADGRLILMAVGDIMLGRTIGEMIRIEGPGAPFQYTADTLASADITLGNLECTISTRGMPADKAYTFRAPPEAAQSLTLAGFDLVSLANNHSLDYGIPAFQDTLAYLSKEGILTVGGGLNEAQAYSPVFIEKEGLRVAFLAYAEVPLTEFDYLSWVAGPQRPGIAWVDHEILARDVRIARTEADVVVVLFHNGYEGMQKPAWIQQSSARLAVDSGASLVIGSHPHVLQPIESYGDGLIVYSMGNFVFDNFLFPPNYSAILEVELTEQGVERYSLIDVIVQLNGIPKIEAYDLDT